MTLANVTELLRVATPFLIALLPLIALVMHGLSGSTNEPTVPELVPDVRDAPRPLADDGAPGVR